MQCSGQFVHKPTTNTARGKTGHFVSCLALATIFAEHIYLFIYFTSSFSILLLLFLLFVTKRVIFAIGLISECVRHGDVPWRRPVGSSHDHLNAYRRIVYFHFALARQFWTYNNKLMSSIKLIFTVSYFLCNWNCPRENCLFMILKFLLACPVYSLTFFPFARRAEFS